MKVHFFIVHLLLIVTSNAQTASQVGFNGSTVGCSAGADKRNLITPKWPTASASPEMLSIVYSIEDTTLTFSITVMYLPTNSRYVIGFQSFGTTSVLTQSGTCDNYSGATYRALATSLWWGHLPNAIGVGSVGAPRYTANGPNGIWNATGVDCDKVRYTATFTLYDLSHCSSPTGTTVITVNTYNPDAAVITLTGTLFVDLIAPFTTTYGGSMWSRAEWTYPFSLVVGATSLALFRIQSSNVILVNFLATNIFVDGATGFLMLDIFALIQSSANNVRMCLSQSDFAAQLDNGQAVYLMNSPPCLSGTPPYYKIISLVVAPNATSHFSYVYDGLYTMRFTVETCAYAGYNCVDEGSIGVSNQYYMRRNTLVSQAAQFSTQITIYQDVHLTIPGAKSIYKDGDTICFEDKLIDLTSADTGLYSITLKSVYLCNAPPDGMIYDGVTKFGCLNQTQVAPLVEGGNLVTPTARDPSYYSVQQSLYAPAGAVGLCFKTRVTIVNLENQISWPTPNGVQYLQVETKVVLPDRKRGGADITSQSVSTLMFVVQKEPNESSTATPESECMAEGISILSEEYYIGLVVFIFTLMTICLGRL